MVIKFGIFTTKIIFFRWNFLLKTSQALKWVSNVLQIWNMSNVLHQWDFWNFRIYPKKHHRKGDYLALILENYTRAKTKMGTFGKSDCFWTTKNGTSGAKIKILINGKSNKNGHFFWNTSLILTTTMTCSPFIPSRNCWGELRFSFKVCLIDQMRFGQQLLTALLHNLK